MLEIMPSLMPENGTKIENGFAVGQEANISSIERCEEVMNRNCNNNYGVLSNHTYDVLDGNALTPSTTTPFVPAPTTALEQYRLQLYNYALHMERLRYIPQDPNQSSHQRQQHYNAVANISSSGYSAPAYNATTPRLALSMSLFPQHMFKSEDPKPQHSYIGLIAMAILSSAELKLVLSDIYQYILDNYPYFRSRGPGWRNSIRHNLSLNDCFVKSGRSANGKGHYWAIHPANMDDFRKGDFRRRKAQRKVRKHMGLSVDDTGTDSPSPPPLDLSSPPPPIAGPTLVSNAHSFTVTQQIAAFNYLHQRQHPITIVGPQLGNQHINFRPLSARYYITSPSSLSCGAQKHDSQNSLPSKTKSTVSSSSTASMIENLYTQSRKRQFDMASLLAPDVTTVLGHDAELGETTTTTTTTLDVDEDLTDIHRDHHRGDRTNGVRTTQLQHTVITKVTMNQCNHHMAMEEEFIDDQNEDIDVVDIASDVDPNEHEHKKQEKKFSNTTPKDCQDESNQKIINEETLQEKICRMNCVLKGEAPNSISTSNSNSRQSPFSDVTTNIEFATSPLNNPEFTASLIENSFNVQSKHKKAEDSNVSLPKGSLHDQMLPDENQQLHCNENNKNNNSSMDSIIFGRYYGSYMAAAARRLHIGSTYNP